MSLFLSMPNAEKKITRREFLNLSIFASFAIAGLSTIYTISRYLYPPTESSQNVDQKILVATLNELPPGSAKFFRYKNKPSVVINSASGITALSAICSHLGCIVKWDSSKHILKCPCHEGYFDVTGRVLGGPPPRPLTALKVTVSDNNIYVGEEA